MIENVQAFTKQADLNEIKLKEESIVLEDHFIYKSFFQL
jgi:hypothetical protein